MPQDSGPDAGGPRRRCSLPALLSSYSEDVEKHDYRKSFHLPPLPQVEPLPRGPFNPFISNIVAPRNQDVVSAKSSTPRTDLNVSPPSLVSSGGIPERFPARAALGRPNDLSGAEIVALVAPKNAHRKPPLQLCGQKRKESVFLGDYDDQRERHRIAEGNRRKNLSQLHRELDSRVHDFFLEKAGWNPTKSMPQSKEHIVQGAIFLIDFMLVIIFHLLGQEKRIPPQCSDKFQSHLRCLQLQQQISGLQQQNQVVSRRLETLERENETLIEQNRFLQCKLNSYDRCTMLRSPKCEAVSSPSLEIPSDTARTKVLPGLRAFCDEVAAIGPDCGSLTGSNALQTSGSHFLHRTPPTTGPSSPVLPQPPLQSPFLA